MQRPKVQMWHAAYDYVRLTWTQEATADEVQKVYQLAAISALAGASGGEVHTRSWGALGYTGVSYGLVQVGRGREGVMLQASQWAAQAVREANPPYTGVPRCDVQVTTWCDSDPGALPRHYAERSAAMAAAQGARKWKVRLVEGYGDGDTAYLGSRHSSTFVRIYDKGRETGDSEAYANALRYEVEFKDSRAEAAWAGEARQAPGREYLAALVQGTLRARGVYLALPASSVAPHAIPCENTPSTVDRRLAWLATQVRGTVDRLLADGVQSEHIAQLLGLSGDDTEAVLYRPVSYERRGV